jgi:uncharacterized protein YndB with AHSA1/START domain
MDIEHELVVDAPVERVFAEFATAEGLASWWTLTSSIEPRLGGRTTFDFGAPYHWAGVIRAFDPPFAIEWEMTETDPMPDWRGTRVGALLTREGERTRVHFHHRGWASATQHARVSSFCWAMYLRLLARHCVTGEVVAYERRNELV